MIRSQLQATLSFGAMIFGALTTDDEKPVNRSNINYNTDAISSSLMSPSHRKHKAGTIYYYAKRKSSFAPLNTCSSYENGEDDENENLS